MKRPPSPDTFLPLKPHWFHVLLSLVGQEQHGYGIMQEVLERTGGKVRLWPGNLCNSVTGFPDPSRKSAWVAPICQSARGRISCHRIALHPTALLRFKQTN